MPSPRRSASVAPAQAVLGPTERVRDEPLGGLLADEYIAVLITAVATRLTRGSTNFYRAHWQIGMLEWRMLLVLERTHGLNGRELATAAGLDKAAVSRSLAALEERGLVELATTRSRGKAAVATLTASGEKLCAEILQASRRRQQSLFEIFPRGDAEALAKVLRRFNHALDVVGWDPAAKRPP